MFPPGPGFGGGLFQLFPVLFMIVFIIIIGTFIFRAVTGIQQWQSNNQQPVLTVQARIVSKRTHVSRHTYNNNGAANVSTSTQYFVTFEVESGDRMELKVPGREYGLMAEGDLGRVTFQGTRFQGFDRL